MTTTPLRSERLTAAAYSRAVVARDARFDGVFYVGITSTRIYCRPICPARVSYPERRRFFDTAAAAEHDGYRPCLRCRPELAPGRAPVDAVSRLAANAAVRIESGALNGASVGVLAAELGVSDRHLRRALERELGVSPLDLARTHRLLLAKRLLADTTLSVTRIAFASGFQSLRRFNAVFQEQYRLSPRELRRPNNGIAPRPTGASKDGVQLSLAYRAPFAWDSLLESLRHEALPGVDLIEGESYARTVALDGHRGTVVVDNVPAKRQLTVEVSAGLVPVLMPLLARLRHLFDLDAEPVAIDKLLTAGGLGAAVRRHPGLRILGAIDGFEVVVRALAGGRVLGAEFDGGVPGLTHLAPTPADITRLGVAGVARVGVERGRAELLVRVAEEVKSARMVLARGGDPEQVARALRELPGIDESLVTSVVLSALGWPDAFPAADRRSARAAQWRPWRGYALLHLRMEEGKLSSRRVG